MHKLPIHIQGTIITVLGVLVLTPDGLLLRLIGADPWSVLFWRGLFMATAICLFYGLVYRGQSINRFRQMGFRGLQAGAFFTFSTMFFVHAIENTSVANTLVIIATAPLFAAIFSQFFLKEKQPTSTWLAILISCGGIGYIFYGSLSADSLTGDLYALFAAFSIASHITSVRQAKQVDMVPSLAIGGIFIAICAAPFAAPLAVSNADMSLLMLLGFVVLPLSFGLITIGPRYIPAAEVSLIMLLETFIGPLWVWFVISETPQSETLIGGLLVLTTLIGHTFYVSRRIPQKPDTAV